MRIVTIGIIFLSAYVAFATVVDIPRVAGMGAADYLECVREKARKVHEENPAARIAVRFGAVDDFVREFVNFGENEEFDILTIEKPDETAANMKALRKALDEKGGLAVELRIGDAEWQRVDGAMAFPFVGAGSGRVIVVAQNGRIVWEQKGCGNIHRAIRRGDDIWYSNGCVYRVPLKGAGAPYRKVECVYQAREARGGGVLGFDFAANGNLVVAENSTCEVAEIDWQNKREVVRFKVNVNAADGTAPTAHGRLRMIRKTAVGTYLVCCSEAKCVREYDAKGKLVWEQEVAPFVFDAVRTADGKTYISNLLGVTAFTPDHKVAWAFTCDDLPDLKLQFLCSVFVRENGNVMVGTWANGSGDGTRAVACEITPQKECVWAFRSNVDRNMMGAFAY